MGKLRKEAAEFAGAFTACPVNVTGPARLCSSAANFPWLILSITIDGGVSTNVLDSD
jgi:hypothetical protein